MCGRLISHGDDSVEAQHLAFKNKKLVDEPVLVQGVNEAAEAMAN